MGQYLYELEVRAKIEDIDLKVWGQKMDDAKVDIDVDDCIVMNGEE